MPLSSTTNYERGLLNQNTTGSNNTAAGHAALYANTTGSNNTGLGEGALNANTTASNNTAVGNSSLNQNTTGTSNTAIGQSAMQANTTGGSNTAVGQWCLPSNTTGVNNTAMGASTLASNTTGGSNTAVGQWALGSNTTASNNTAMGASALGSNTTGSQNVALGASALSSNTTASNNVAVGQSALTANTTGTQNVGIGQSALGSNTTGSNNMAMGQSALGTNTTGTQNIAIGQSALSSNTTASNNTAIGQSALGSTTTGANNLAIGQSTLTVNTTGAYNAAVGNSSLQKNITGSYNTAYGALALGLTKATSNKTGIGYQAGYNDSLGSNNTFIGYQADINLKTSTYTNATAIGYSAQVAQSNSLILGGTGGNAVSVGIGTSTPSATLDVIGKTKTSTFQLTTSPSSNYVLTSDASGNGTWSANAANEWHLTGNSGTTAGTNYIGTSDAKDLVIKTTGNEAVRVTAGGNLGINNSAAACLLNVTRSTAAAPASSGTTTTAIARFDAQNNALDMGAYTASPYGNWIQSTAVGNLATTMPIALNPNGGNIGIGTASPSYALSFSGQASKQIWMERNTTAATAGNDLTLQSSGCTSASTNKAGGNLYLNSGTSTGTGTSDVYIGTSTAGSSGTTDNAPSTKVYIKGNGMVGIGHSSPIANLSIYGTTNSGFSPTCWGGTSSGPEISFSRGGFYTVGASIQMIDYNAYSSGLCFNVHKGTNNGGGGTFADNWPIEVVQAMTIDNKGYVGVGVADPKSTLDVGGSLALKLSTQSGSIAVTLDNTATIWYFTGTASILLPLATSYTNRVYTIVNRTGSSKTISSFTSLSGSATTSIAANSSIEIVSNGIGWLQIR